MTKKLKIISEEREEIFLQKQQEKKSITKKLQETKVDVDGKKKTAKELCKRNDFLTL